MPETAFSDDSYEAKRLELKRRLLRKAWDGQSKLSGPEMIAAIERITQENRKPMPEGHTAILRELEEEDREAAERGEKIARSIKSLNAQARHKGWFVRFIETSQNDDSDGSSNENENRNGNGNSPHTPLPPTLH